MFENFNVLPRMFMCIGAFLVAISVSPQSALANQLTNEEFAQQIVGKTLLAKRRGMTMRLVFAPEGTLSMKALLMKASGTWRYSKQGVCITMETGPRKGTNCVTFERIGKNKYKSSEGKIFTLKN